MTFNDVIEDIKKLVGLDLQSIRPGANIRIIEIDEERSCLILQTSTGACRSRPIGELQLIWNELNRLPAVHVDEVLHGSGTSRNQPETILANLPYVEWLKIDNKKHIAFIGKNTHHYGTLKQMDAIEALNIKRSSRIQRNNTQARIMIVTNDVSGTIQTLQNSLSGTVSTAAKGVYTFENGSLEAIIVSQTSTVLSSGTYSILKFEKVSRAKTVRINDQDFFAFENGSIKILIEK